MTMHPDTNRLATGLAITRAPRIRRRVWVRRLSLAGRVAAVILSAVAYAGVIYLIFMIAFAGGGE